MSRIGRAMVRALFAMVALHSISLLHAAPPPAEPTFDDEEGYGYAIAAQPFEELPPSEAENQPGDSRPHSDKGLIQDPEVDLPHSSIDAARPRQETSPRHGLGCCNDYGYGAPQPRQNSHSQGSQRRGIRPQRRLHRSPANPFQWFWWQLTPGRSR